MFTITIGVTGDNLWSVTEAAEAAVAKLREAPDPSLAIELADKAVSYAFHENDEHSTFSAQITRTPSLKLTET